MADESCIHDAAGTAASRSLVYVVYPAALFDGWEVVKEPGGEPVFFDTREEATSFANARAMSDGGAIVKLENWFGDTESVRVVEPQASRPLAPATT